MQDVLVEEQLVEKRLTRLLRRMQVRPWSPHRLALECMKKWGLTPAEAREYVRRARELFILEINRSKQELRCEAVAFYQSVLDNPRATIGAKLRARERMDKILGLEEPVRQEVELNVRRNMVPVDSIPLELRKRLLEQLQIGHGNGNGNGGSGGPGAGCR